MTGEGTDERVYLLVDDQAMNRKMLSAVLKGLTTCMIDEAENGREAVEKLVALGDRAAGVLCDFHMPEMDGLHLLKQIRTGDAGVRRDLAFALMTSANEKDAVGTAIALEADAFLAKPVRKPVLEANLSRLIPDAATTVLEAEAYSSVPVADAVENLPMASVSSSAPDDRLHEVAVAELGTGAVLGRDIVSDSGRVLAPAGSTLRERGVALLKDLAAIEPTLATVWLRYS